MIHKPRDPCKFVGDHIHGPFFLKCSRRGRQPIKCGEKWHCCPYSFVMFKLW